MPQEFNVLIAAEIKNITEEEVRELHARLEEHGLEKIPTIDSAWEMRCEAEDETDAKDQAIQAFVNVARTHPCEVGLVAQCGTSQILRRRKKFEP